jgi:glycerol-3-phosphate acyltransferase PlsY
LPSGAIYIILTSIAFYLIGSIPVAYIIVKAKHKKDITLEGSGNVGTLNALKVSQSRITGAAVLLADFLKGAVPAYVLIYVLKADLIFAFISSVFLVIGHNYPVWLRFKGGRGLATTAGIFSIVNILLILTWCVFWVFYFFFIKKDVLAANFTATALSPFFGILFKPFYVDAMAASPPEQYFVFVIYVFVVSIIVLSRHLEIFRRKISL